MKKVFILLMILVFGLCLPVFTFAEVTEENPLLPDTLLPGMIESTGTHFEVTNSEYLNVVLESSETITLRLESVPEMVTMHIEPASETTSSQITISGFQPLTTYYKYEDDYHNEEIFTTDGNGRYIYIQDISMPHLVFIQPRKSTKFIKDDATGGDCTSIGTWDSATKTCTLTTDVYESIQIDSNYITLDGNGHTITGTGTGYGVYLPMRTGVTIKNLNVNNFSSGIDLWYSSNNALSDNTTSNNGSFGIHLWSSNNNTLIDNTISNNYFGIYLYWYSNNNTLTSNIAYNNSSYGIHLYYSSNNKLTSNSVASNGAGILFGYSNNNTLTNNTISNHYGAGVVLGSSSSNKIYNNNFIGNLGWGYGYCRQACVFWGSSNVFNLEKPTGGNYWSNFDTPSEGCYDANNDGFCDAPYYFYGGVDYLPWARQSGWEVPVDTIPPTVTVTASPNILWPPNHKIVDVKIDGSAIDDESGIASVVITVADEYGIYNMTVPSFESTIQIEAWRDGTDKDGRAYTITVVATDKAGNQSTAITEVIVPHDMRK